MVIDDDFTLLRTLIEEWCKKKQNTIYRLSDKTGLNYKTVSNIAKGITKSPLFANIVKILIAIDADEEHLSRFSKGALGDADYIADIFNKEPVHKKGLDMIVRGRKIEDFIICPFTYEIITILANRPYSKEQINTLYGVRGLLCLEDLIQAEIATKNDTGLFFVDDFNLPEQAIKTCIEHQMIHCDEQSLENKSASLLNFTLACTMDELMQLNHDVRDFVYKRIKNMKHSGDINVFLSAIVGQFPNKEPDSDD